MVTTVPPSHVDQARPATRPPGPEVSTAVTPVSGAVTGAVTGAGPSSRSHRSVLVGLCAALVLCVLIPGYLVAYSPGPGQLQPGIGLLLWTQVGVTVWAGANLTGMLATATLRPLAFFFWTYVYIWLGVAGVAQVATGQSPVPVRGGTGYLADAQLAVIIGLVGYLVGGRLVGRKPVGGRTAGAEPADAADPVCSRRPIRGYLVAVAAFVALSPLLVRRLGGLHALFTSREATSLVLRTGGLIAPDDKAAGTLLVSAVTVTAFMLLYGLLWKASLVGPLAAREWGGVVVLVALNAVVNNPISSARHWFGTVLVSILLLVPAVHRPRLARAGMAATLAALLLVFPYADHFRYTDPQDRAAHSPVQELVDKGDYDSFPQVRAAAEYVGANGHTLGRQIEGVLLFWVPRQAWPDKPLDTGILLARFEGNSLNSNLSAPLWAESYLDFGLPGVLAIFVALGAVSRRADEAFVRDFRQRLPTAACLAVPVLAVYQVIVLRGSLLQSMFHLSLIAVLMVCLFRREEMRRGSPCSVVR